MSPPSARRGFPLWIWLAFVGSTAAKVTKSLQQGWDFQWTPTGAPVPVPITTQCDTLHITWQRPNGQATGPSGVAPYYLQVYTSTFVVPFVIPAGSSGSFDWPVPFIPNTQYEICMFDSNGNTGGCQAVYTVTTNPNITLDQPVVCTNLTYPQESQVLDVEGAFSDGPFSQYGWPNQCTDIQLTPKNGTPPYTLTVAPALHPPYNITSDNMNAINWTVSLNWGQPFFMSLVDSKGNTWAAGPLHAGGNGPTACLDLSASLNRTVSSTTAIGSAIGALVLGAIVAFIATWLLRRFRRRRDYRSAHTIQRGAKGSLDEEGLAMPRNSYTRVPSSPGPGGAGHELGFAPGHRSEPSTTSTRVPSQYQIEPFIPPAAIMSPPALSGASSSSEGQISHTQSISQASGAEVGRSSTTTGGQVYVVHHDGGRAPVTVYTSDGTEVVELPPRYDPASRPALPTPPGGAGGAAAAPFQPQQRRRPDAARKMNQMRSSGSDPSV